MLLRLPLRLHSTRRRLASQRRLLLSSPLLLRPSVVLRSSGLLSASGNSGRQRNSRNACRYITFSVVSKGLADAPFSPISRLIGRPRPTIPVACNAPPRTRRMAPSTLVQSTALVSAAVVRTSPAMVVSSLTSQRMTSLRDLHNSVEVMRTSRAVPALRRRCLKLSRAARASLATTATNHPVWSTVAVTL